MIFLSFCIKVYDHNQNNNTNGFEVLQNILKPFFKNSEQVSSE